MKTFHVKNSVWQEDKFFVAQCLNLDISSFGDTKEDALNNLDEALDLYFEDANMSIIQQIEHLK